MDLFPPWISSDVYLNSPRAAFSLKFPLTLLLHAYKVESVQKRETVLSQTLCITANIGINKNVTNLKAKEKDLLVTLNQFSK